ncbi:MAG: hypothetical protein ACREK8_00280, partial [Gemmatimonadales bacterium]
MIRRILRVLAFPLVFVPAFVGTAAAQQSCPAMRPGDLPLKYAGGPTVAAISACDLMTRLYIYADDSMRGREVGTPAHLSATSYIEREVRRLGLQPAGDSGTYFQNIPVVVRGFDTASTVTVGATVYHGGVDFIAQSSGLVRPENDAPSVYIGAILDTLTVLPLEQTKGKVLIFLPPDPGVNAQAIEAKPGFQRWYNMYQ